VLLRDTTNRSDHKLLLSRQALEIAKRNGAGRKANEPLFPIVDARKTLAWINEEAGTKVQGHGLRATFASIAEDLVSSALLKHRVDTDHRSSSRIQAPKSAAADSGHVIVIVVAPRRSSIWMSPAVPGGDAAGSDTGTNSAVIVAGALPPSRASCRQRCTTLALMPCDIATLATDAQGAPHSASTCACSSAL
jgi:hypothetical protein